MYFRLMEEHCFSTESGGDWFARSEKIGGSGRWAAFATGLPDRGL